MTLALDRASETVTIARLAHKGDGVADTSRGELFVAGTLPGEVVEVVREGERGRLVAITSASPDRVDPPCVHFGICGGCSLQHMATTTYRAFKRQQIIDAFADRGIEAEVADLEPVQPQSRRRAVIAVQRRPEGITAGFRERASHNVVEIPGCQIITPAIRALLPKIARLMGPFTFGKKGAMLTVLDTETGLDVSVSDAELRPDRRQEAIAKAMEAGLARFTIDGDLLVEARSPTVRFGGVTVTLPAGGFLQAVAEAEVHLADHVLAALGNAKIVADLFCGAGTFTLRIAKTARVHGVESDKPALAALDKARRQASGLKAVSIELRDLYRRPLMPAELKAYDAVVFDPPRDGAAPQAKQLAASKVATIVAVSCNPATLARDARYLVDAGYRMDKVHAVDQFLWSHHVEAVAVFRRPA